MTMVMSELSPDLVEEVLCRVPATYLQRLRSTCKGWNHLITDDKRFHRKHFDKAARQFRPLVLRHDSRVCSFSVDLHREVKSEKLSIVDPRSKNEFKIHAFFHCDGLLLCNSEDRSTIVAWNPCTGETKWIRTGELFRTDSHYFYLGYCKDNRSGNKSYKLLSRHGLGYQSSLIYDFDSDSWRIIDDVIPGWSTAYNDYGLSLKGNVYWIVRHETDRNMQKNETDNNKYLLSFDFSTEKSQPVPLPYQVSWYANLCLSVVRDEKLCVLVQLDDTSKTEIWVTNKIDDTSKAVSWTKLLALDLSDDLQLCFDGSFFLDEEKKLVIFIDRWIQDKSMNMSKDMVYIVGEDNNVTSVILGLDTYDGTLPTTLSYSPSLVQIKRAGAKRKRGD